MFSVRLTVVSDTLPKQYNGITKDFVCDTVQSDTTVFSLLSVVFYPLQYFNYIFILQQIALN